MRIDAMQSFVKLVECGSYTAAAEALFMSTSTVHSHIKTLETDLQANLVAFTRGRLQLTHAGNLFLVFAQRTIREYERLQEELSRRNRPPTVALRVTSLPSIGIHVLPPAVRAFVACHPDVHITIDTRRIGEALAVLSTGQADLAVVLDVHANLPESTFKVSELMVERGMFVMRSSMDTGSLSPLEILASFPLSVQPPNNLHRRALERWAASKGVQLQVRFEHSSFDGIVNDVLAGDYVGLISDHVKRFHPESSQLRELMVPDFDERHIVVALYPKQSSPMVERFVEFFRDFCAQSMAE